MKRPPDVVGLDVIHAPVGVHLHDQVLMVLRARAAGVDAVHVGIPRADRYWIGNTCIFSAPKGVLLFTCIQNNLGDEKRDA